MLKLDTIPMEEEQEEDKKVGTEPEVTSSGRLFGVD